MVLEASIALLVQGTYVAQMKWSWISTGFVTKQDFKKTFYKPLYSGKEMHAQ